MKTLTAQELPKQNTDRELWRERPNDAYSDRIFITGNNKGLGIECAGHVIVMTPRDWHSLAKSRGRL